MKQKSKLLLHVQYQITLPGKHGCPSCKCETTTTVTLDILVEDGVARNYTNTQIAEMYIHEAAGDVVGARVKVNKISSGEGYMCGHS